MTPRQLYLLILATRLHNIREIIIRNHGLDGWGRGGVIWLCDLVDLGSREGLLKTPEGWRK